MFCRAADKILLSLVVAVGIGAGCKDRGRGGEDDTSGDESEVATPPEDGGVGIAGLRRLSRNEFDNTLRDLVGDDTRPATRLLPEDLVDPFDNDFTTQEVSAPLILAFETLAADVSTRLLADKARRDDVVGCTPSGTTDEACLREFVEQFGRRALRRPLSSDEIDVYVNAANSFAEMSDDFYEGIDIVLRTLLQHPRFIYRVETGTPTSEADVYALDNWEVATRLSYFLLGTTPSDALLDRAAAGELATSDQVLAAAHDLLDSDEARARVDRFHSMWLGYVTMPHDAELTAAMRTETKQLLERVIFDDERPWTDIFTSEGTFVDDRLAAHYGFDPPGSSSHVWVDYDDPNRRGLLAHGTFLSVSGAFGDTSPTRRGKLIRNRLLCQEVPPPPPDVNVDDPPQGGECKWDRYAAHRETGTSCKGCHELMDPVGFGLENYDRDGRFREHEPGLPQCEIEGQGDLDGVDFRGPAELAERVLASGRLEPCISRQLVRFAMGHTPDEHDRSLIDELEAQFDGQDARFLDLLLTLVGNDAFRFRREEDPR